MWRALLQDVELMPQHQDFGFKPTPRLKTVAQHADEKKGNSEHQAIMFRFAGDCESNGWGFRNRQVPCSAIHLTILSLPHGDALLDAPFARSLGSARLHF
jgi:hypothetical protein